MDGPRHLQTREEFTENEKRGNHLRPQSTAEKTRAAVLLITRTLQVQFVVLVIF